MYFTKVSVPDYLPKINNTDSIYSIGSCFSENIGSLLIDHQFDCLNNTFGTVFNPISIADILDSIFNKNAIDLQNIVHRNDVFLHYLYHSSIYGMSETELLTKIKNKHAISQDFFEKCDWLIVTFGTSIVYENATNDHLVSNCHKMPRTNFRRRILTTDEIIHRWSSLINKIFDQYPDIKILFTVSPVRHTKEGLLDNAVSKARLLDACFNICETFDQVYYFPSYEIMIDELRDYRYYSEDTIHPSDQAIDYIWNAFVTHLLDNTAQGQVADIAKLNTAVNHRLLHPESIESINFKTNLLSKIGILTTKYPHINFQEYRNALIK